MFMFALPCAVVLVAVLPPPCLVIGQLLNCVQLFWCAFPKNIVANIISHLYSWYYAVVMQMFIESMSTEHTSLGTYMVGSIIKPKA